MTTTKKHELVESWRTRSEHWHRIHGGHGGLSDADITSAILSIVNEAVDELERKVEILSGGVTGKMVTENRCLRGYVAMLFQLIDANSKSWGHAEIAAVDRVRAAFEPLAGRSEWGGK